MLHVEKLRFAASFTHKQAVQLMTGKPSEYNSKLYSDEYKRKFKADDVTAQVGTKESKLILAINGQRIGERFKGNLNSYDKI